MIFFYAFVLKYYFNGSLQVNVIGHSFNVFNHFKTLFTFYFQVLTFFISLLIGSRLICMRVHRISF